MAATITISRVSVVPGGGVVSRGTGNLGTYATGGVAVTANKFGLGEAAFELKVFGTTSGHAFTYDKTNKKIMSFTQGVATGATSAAALANGALPLNDAGSEGTARVSTTAASTTYKFGPQLEVTNSTDLSAVTFSWEASGLY